MSDPTKPFRGGRVFTDDDNPDAAKPQRLRYPCFAAGCPMPGTLFPEHARTGVCAWHYAAQPTDIPKITYQLQAWECVAREIEQGRRVLCGPTAADPAAQEAAFNAAWARLRPLLSAGWETELRPAAIRSSKGEDRGHRQSYGDWLKHLERFLGARVVEVLSTHRRSEEASPRQRALDVVMQGDEEGPPW
jgi:hypothetical protein